MNAAKPTAIKIRDAVLPWLEDNGRLEQIIDFDIIQGEIGDFTFQYRTPSNGRPAEYKPKTKEEAEFLNRHGPATLPFAMVILHQRKRVLMVSWKERNEHLGTRVTFMGSGRGAWEAELLSLMASVAPQQ